MLSKSTSLLAAALSLAFAGHALAAEVFSDAQLKTAAALRDSARTGNLSYAIAESLTTEVGPRMAGGPNDARAVAWAEAKMHELGFDKIWKEAVTFPKWVRGVESAAIVAPFPQPLHVTSLGLSVATPPGGVKAAVVRFATYQDLVAAPADAVRGKIVFIDHKMQNDHEYGMVQAGRMGGPSEAARKGAVAIVIRSVGTDSHRFAHTGVTRYAGGVEKLPAAAMSNADSDLLVRMLKRGAPVTLALELGGHMDGTATSYNVIGEITGSEKPDEYVLMGGHLDSWDLGTGAIDDAAGVAISLGAADMIRREGIKPKRSIRVVLFANEEQGLYGGRAYLEEHKGELARIQAAAEADEGQGPVLQLDAFVAPAAEGVVRQMQQVLAPMGVKAGGSNANPGPDMGGLKAAGVASFGLVLDAHDYFDLHHTADDTFDKIEPARIMQSCAAYATWAYMAAQAPVSFGSGTLKAVPPAGHSAGTPRRPLPAAAGGAARWGKVKGRSGEDQGQFGRALLERRLGAVEVGIDLGHGGPEGRAVVHLADVRQLVRHHVVDQRQRIMDQAPVQADVALDRARAPAGAGRGEREGVVLHAQAGSEVVQPFPEQLLGLEFEPAPHALDQLPLFQPRGHAHIELLGGLVEPAVAARCRFQPQRDVGAEEGQAGSVAPFHRPCLARGLAVAALLHLGENPALLGADGIVDFGQRDALGRGHAQAGVVDGEADRAARGAAQFIFERVAADLDLAPRRGGGRGLHRRQGGARWRRLEQRLGRLRAMRRGRKRSEEVLREQLELGPLRGLR
jgi:hypothetical protein